MSEQKLNKKRGPKGPRGRNTGNDYKREALFAHVYFKIRDEYVPVKDVFMILNKDGERVTIASYFGLDKNTNRKYFESFGLIDVIKKDGLNQAKWIGPEPTKELQANIAVKYYNQTQIKIAEKKESQHFELDQMEIPLVVEEPKKEETPIAVNSNEDYKNTIVKLQTKMVEVLNKILIEQVQTNLSLEGLSDNLNETKNEIHEFVKWGNKLKEDTNDNN